MQVEIPPFGFVRLVDSMPRENGDAAIVQAARVSYGAGTKTPSDDETLIRYLMRNRHTTPFEMVVLKFHVKMPIFVARQWVRHRTASLNEVSARYSEIKDEFWTPDAWRVQSTTNKQGSSEKVVDVQLLEWENEDRVVCEDIQQAAYSEYKRLLQQGVSRELARSVLPVSVYTEMYWMMNLHNLFHFLHLRADKHAQKEIRDYAEPMIGMVGKLCPMATQAFMDYRVNAITLSAPEIDHYNGVKPLTNNRERAEFEEKMRRLGEQ